MHKWLLSLIANGSVFAGAWAQLPPDGALEPASPLIREQRRVELRSALQSQNQRDRAAAVGAALVVERHLNEQERAEIRQQLRQQHATRPTARP